MWHCAESNDMGSLGKWPQICQCALPIPVRRKNKEDWKTQIRNSILTQMQDTRDARHQWNHAKIPTHQKNTRKPIKDMMNLKRGSLTNMKQQHTRSHELLERQHTTRTAAAANDEAQILEQQHATIATAVANEETETIEQHTAVTARKEETIDNIDQELLALMNKTTEIITVVSSNTTVGRGSWSRSNC